MDNSNSNYGYRNSNETNSPALASSRAPVGHVAAGSSSNLSRPRLVKMRKHTSFNFRSSVNSRAEDTDFSLGFNPFRSSSESVFGNSSSVNVPKKSFSFTAGSRSSNLGSESLIVDDLSKMQIDSDKSYTNVDQLPERINKLNIGDSSNNVHTNKNQFTNSNTFVFEGNSKSDENLISDKIRELKVGGAQDDNMKKIVFETLNYSKKNKEENAKDDLISDKMRELKVGGDQDDNIEKKLFGLGTLNNSKQNKEENVKDDLISDKMRELKVGGDQDDNMRSILFGLETLNNSKQNKEENVKDDLITDKMRELKVSGGGLKFVFGQNVEPKVYDSTPSSNFQPFGNAKFTSSPLKNVDFTFSSKLDNFGAPKAELKKKKKGKVRNSVIGQPQTKQYSVFGQSSVQNPESFEAYSPMDVSPYQETLADIYSRDLETSVKSSDDDNASQINDQNSVSSESHMINSNITIDEELIGATQRLNVNDSDEKCEVSEAETFISAMENIEYSSDTFATALDSDLSSTATSGKQEKTGTRLFKFGSQLENINKDNFTFAASMSSQGQHKKKHRSKTGQDSYSPTSDARNKDASSSSFILSSGNMQKVDMPTLPSRNKDKFKPINEQDSKHGNLSTASASIAAEEACEKWRLRGNQAYGNGDLAKAEDYYTQGLNAVSQTEKSKDCLRALMLCYSNRAATRISLGKMKDALKDCLMAAAIDPNFLKVQVRAAHCYLAIGEVEKASLQYMKCLQSGSEVCVDKKMLVEASEGLEKSQKLTECFKQYTELPRRTPDELESALRIIDEALQISSYSEKLLQMKADTLLMLRKFEQIIQMCEQTLSVEISQTPTSSSSWRSNLIVKSYFYLGRLVEAHEFIKKEESSGLLTERLESMSLESVIPLADTIRELLSRKAAGNEAYKSGKYAEAVEHYTSALSCSVESRPFAAICFCNRAAAYRSLGQIADAIADCSLAIALDPNYLKAISRRASLYEIIRDYGQAAKDLRKLVSLFTSQIEERGIFSGVPDKTSGMNELRQTQLQLYNIEEESRKEIPLNMYLILGVESTAAASDIKKAYRKAALKHHPDKAALSVSRSDNGDDGLWKEIAENVYKDADRLFKMIGEAYAVLSSPSKRSQYDMDEEMRNEVNKYTRSNSGRMAPDVQSPMYERSGSRRWQDNSWRPFVNSQSKGQEKPTSSYKYSRQT